MNESGFVFSPRSVAQHLNSIFFENREVSPLRLTIGLTRKCNLSCIFCWRIISREHDWQEIEDNDLLRLIDEASEMGIRLLHIQGEGEPFLRGRLCTGIMKKAKELGLHGTITTNGTLMTLEMLEEMVRCQWDEIKLSVDAPEAGLHDFFRNKPGVFKRVMESIVTLQNLKKAYRAEKPLISLLYVVNALNYTKIPEMFSLMKDMSLQAINFLPLRIYGDSAQKLSMNCTQREELNGIILDVEKSRAAEHICHNLDSFIFTSRRCSS